MKVAILIGFNYGEDSDQLIEDPERTPLPGIVVDLYQAYVAAITMEADKIVIITDIMKDQHTAVLLNAMINGIVDDKILTFIETIKQEKCYHYFIGKLNFISRIAEAVSSANEIFVYYTGHVVHGYILFPHSNLNVTFIENPLINNSASNNLTLNNSALHPLMLSLLDFRKLILTPSYTSEIIPDKPIDRHQVQVFLIMDCCNGNGLELPFRLNDQVYRLSQFISDEQYKYTVNRSNPFIPEQVICFSSTMSDESSITSRDGSIFTRSLFKQLKNQQQSVIELLQIVGKECITKYDQTATIHASYPTSKMLWNWIFGPTSLRIIPDHLNNILIINIIPNIKIIDKSNDNSKQQNLRTLECHSKLKAVSNTQKSINYGIGSTPSTLIS